MQARDIMTRGVVTVRPDTPLLDIAGALITHRISGVPVVDAAGQVVGIISEGDLYRRPELGTERPRRRWIEFFTSNAALARDYVHTHGHKAADVMSRRVVQVPPDTPVSDIADIFERRNIKRVPVVDGGRLVGIVSRSNLVQALACSQPGVATAAEVDRRIREDLMREYASQPWGERFDSNVIVTDGVVHLWGIVDSPTEAEALRVAAEAVPNVKQVVDHLTVLEPDPDWRWRGEAGNMSGMAAGTGRT